MLANKSNSKNKIKNKNDETKKVQISTPKKKEKAIDHKCPGCGAPIFFIPKLGKWKCEYCNGEYNLEDFNKKKKNNELAEDTYDEYTSYKCKNCGAEIVADKETSATFCVYCGNTAILKSKLSGQFKPDYIIPFKVEKESAVESFKGLSKGRPFLPKDFNDINNIEKIRGIYIPFWIYDMFIQGGIEARGQLISTWSRGDTRYTRTDYYKMFRNGSIKYNKIPIDGSSRFDNEIMSSIEPFNYKDLVPYDHAFLSGFLAERYDIDGDTLIGNAVNRAVESTKQIFLSDTGNYVNKSIFNSSLLATDVTKKYVLLPVWMVNVKYKDKYYLFAMNGQTGEFIGDMPVDKKKVVTWIVSMGLGIFIGVILIAYIIFKMGGLFL